MGDMYCKKCGEPWDAYGVIMALEKDEGDMTKEEAERFMRGEGCPCCGFGKYCPSCKGDGMCSMCYGTGIERTRDAFSGTVIERVCSWCDGTGKCHRCGGTGKLKGKHDEEYYNGLLEADGEIDVLGYL